MIDFSLTLLCVIAASIVTWLVSIFGATFIEKYSDLLHSPYNQEKQILTIALLIASGISGILFAGLVM